MSDPEILATLQASTPRRWFAVGVLSMLGVLLVVLSFNTAQAGFLYQAFLMIIGALALLEARRLWRATEQALELTRDALRIRGGEIIVTTDNIEAVDRGVFAFKPSNGFLLRTKEKGARVWSPGMYWRFGRRIGVGGATAASQAKFMSEIISAILAERE
ncbi:hypothetical protein [Cognatishimia sp. MH4019]|uniref:hypothetical protein n=1 Tax=Cognatishimia sp. MH4019 TaxID=2854030 RepID=UPI001CD78394|nr:hypothetical protein [Cognatishimia sp. MH4019]